MDQSQKNRNFLVQRIAEINRNLYDSEYKTHFSIEQKRAMAAEQKVLYKKYKDELPKVPIAWCPFCKTVLKIGIDIYGLDWKYWHEWSWEPNIESCQHYIDHFYALHYQGRVPNIEQTGIDGRILSGPEVPYIIPKLLNKERIQAIISTFPIENWIYTAYFISYFWELKIEKNSYFNAGWDFELRPWLEKIPRRVGWMEPWKNDGEVHTGSENCPYIDIKGSQSRMICYWGELREEPNPDGSQDDFQNAFDA